MGLDFEYVSGQTPLDEYEKEGLLIETILSRRDLDEFERLNIEKAIEWTINNKFKSETILSEDIQVWCKLTQPEKSILRPSR